MWAGARAQRPALVWATQFTGTPSTSFQFGSGVVVAYDHQGNVYTAGTFRSPTDFDPGPGVTQLQPAATGISTLFLAKQDAQGALLWVKALPISNDQPLLGVDAQDNVYLASSFSGGFDINPGGAYTPVQADGAFDALLVKYSPQGSLVWVHTLQGATPEAQSYFHKFCFDNNGNLVLTGGFAGRVDFDPGAGSHLITGRPTGASFIMSLDGNGDFRWMRQLLYAIDDVRCNAAGSIFICARINATTDLDPGAGVYTVTYQGSTIGVLARLTPTADLVWADVFSTTSTANGAAVLCLGISPDGFIYAGGNFHGTIDFDTGPGNLSLHTLGLATFLAKFSDDGKVRWVRAAGSTGNNLLSGISFDAVGYSYVLGTYSGPVDFDPGSGQAVYTFPTNQPVMARYDPDGHIVWVLLFQPVGAGRFLPMDLQSDPAGNFYIPGVLSGTVDFDPGPAVQALSNPAAATNAATVKLGPCPNRSFVTLQVDTCRSYSLNGHRYDSSGTYYQTIGNAAGCDSVITLQLTIHRSRQSRTVYLCAGDSVLTGGAFQSVSGIFVDTLRTAAGCDSLLVTELTVEAPPHPDLGADGPACRDALLNPGSFAVYRWQDGSALPTYRVTAPGLYWVQVANNAGCTATDSLQIDALRPPLGRFLAAGDTICPLDTRALTAYRRFAAYRWSTGSTQRSIVVDSPGLYWLEVNDGQGCSGRDSTVVRPGLCRKNVYFPSAFTPNGDGKNDFFGAWFAWRMHAYHLQVFDRWGRIVFDTKDPNARWDGTVDRKPAGTSVFVWQCTYQLEGEAAVFSSGTVSLIR